MGAGSCEEVVAGSSCRVGGRVRDRNGNADDILEGG